MKFIETLLAARRDQGHCPRGHQPSLVKGGLVGLLSLTALAACTPPAAEERAPTVAAVASKPEPDVKGSQRHLRLISQHQYFSTIADVFGPDVVPNVSFAPFQRTEGLLATGAAYEGVGESQLETYQRAATIVANLVVAPERRSFLIPCKPADEKAADDACVRKFLGYAGQRFFRRPLTNEKLDELVAQARGGAERLNDFYAGLSLALEGVLLSPRTLYIEEVVEPDPTRPGRSRLDSYSMASRLSFFLWNMGPDDALLKAAAKGDLYRPEARARVVDAMLASPKVEHGVRAFFDDMMAFDDYGTLAKDANVYPAFTGAVIEDSREQTLRMIVDHLIARRGDYRDLYTTRATFISPALATLYREPGGATWKRYEAPADSPRVGLLTQISFLALHSHPGRSSPTRRGKALRELLLCQPVPPPPANVDFSAVENPDPRLRTARDRLNFHSENPVCAGCHKITDPMGLALENFDGAGAYRTTEKGAPIDVSGALDGKPFKDVAGLGQALRDHPALPSCLVRRVYTYAVGGRVAREDQPFLAYATERFGADGYRLPSLLRTIALSNAFVEVDTQTTQAASAETASDGKK